MITKIFRKWTEWENAVNFDPRGLNATADSSCHSDICDRAAVIKDGVVLGYFDLRKGRGWLNVPDLNQTYTYRSVPR